jgi:hypothetical protein
MKININIKRFNKYFNREYDFLYNNRDKVAGYTEALDAFNKFIVKNSGFVGEFSKYRGDLISSDREAVAFMFALEIMEIEQSLY